MPKIIDAFLFFQELDLLDIRLAYLDPYVDVFVIVEACQTFSGKQKPFVLEKNIERYSRYKSKIRYQKIVDFHDSFASVRKFLEGNPSASNSKVLSILLAHDHYPKSGLHWVLDCYHRERIHCALDEFAGDEDIVIISDLDEVPSRNIFLDGTLSTVDGRPRVCRQHEFRYFVNFYKDSDWFGSIFSAYRHIRDVSLNTLRIDSKSARTIVDKEAITFGGYHFTSCGSIEAIAAKIKSWTHQEFNNSTVLERLEHNVRTGQDIFGREFGTNLTKVSLGDARYFDESIAEILEGHPNLICAYDILQVRPNWFYQFLNKIMSTCRKVIYKTSTIFR